MKKNFLYKLLVTMSYLLMITINILANALPLNGKTTGEISEKYPNLFTPANITFSIWLLIYLLLGAFTVYQWFLNGQVDEKRINKIRILFIISSVVNAAWLVAWHYEVIPLTVVLMMILLVSLILIMNEITKVTLDLKDQILVKLPFSVYFGWITIATIANITVFLVSINWNGFGLPDAFWTIVVLLLGVIISGFTILRNNDLAYGLVIIWAYLGILFKHLSPTGFAGEYVGVIITVIICLILLLAIELYLLFRKKN